MQAPISVAAVREHMKLLGFKVKDVVTGFSGVVTSIGFDLYGCVQAIVSPGLDDKGQPGESRWFDMKRLVTTADEAVMEIPSFEVVPGPEYKPAAPTTPTR